KNAPCIIFIDEIDAVGRARSMGMSGGHEEREQTLNQLLVEMDGFEANEGIILIAATNRADILDKALLRPGRFDRQVQVNLPDSIGREKILGIHSKNVPLGPDVDLARIAKGTPTFSGADLANLVNEAALLAARANKRVVTQEDFENAKDKVTMGPERRSAVRTEEEIELVAYHEGGHALVGVNVPLRDKLNKVTIIPRGGAGGYAQFLPENDAAMLKRKEQWKAELAMAYGGRIAEELIYGVDHVTAGAISDIQMATQQARVMVERLGFSERLGLRAFGPDQSEGMFGSMTKNYSDDYAKIIDEEVEQILKTAETTAREIISDNLEGLKRLKEALIEYETLSREEVEAVLRGETLERESRRVEPTRHADSSETETPAPKPAPKPASGTSALPGIGGPAADS
ncbi:MAG: AAA family ATPase, partial [Pseudomonadota bacterium]|nr:AAA family ATPase [Pseudomonadota bacterium]